MAFCQPPKGQIYLTIGQDLLSVQDYIQVQYNYSLHANMNASMEQQGNNQTQQREQHVDDVDDILSRHHSRIPTIKDSLPAAVMVYTDIQTLKGLDIPTDYGSGIEYANGLFTSLYYQHYSDDYSSSNSNNNDQQQHGTGQRRQPQQRHGSSDGAGLQIGLWLNGTLGCRDIIHGTLDNNIQKLLHYIVTSPFEYIFLRVGYEFDNPSFGYTSTSSDSNDDDAPNNFQQAFRYIVQACRNHDVEQHRQQHRLQSSICMNKTIFVWHSWAASFTTSHQLARYYPGNDFVDWIGISLFSQLYNNNTIPNGINKLGSMETVQAVLDFAQQPSNNKPVMIAESTPFGGIPNLLDPWQDWFVPVMQLIRTNQNIAMWSYIHCDWDHQPMWQHVGFGDSRLNVNETVLQQWQQHVMQNDAPRFLQHGSLSRYCNTKRRRARGDATRSSNMAMIQDSVMTLRYTTTDDKTWHAPAAVSRVDIEMAWVAGIGIGLLVMILGSCQYYWRTSSSSSQQCIDSVVHRGDDDDKKGNDHEDDERQALVEPNRTSYGSLKYSFSE